MKKRYFIIPLLFLILSRAALAQTVWFVRPAATGAGDGTSWTDAFTDLHAALDAAQAGDAVWVAEGTYKPDSGTNRARAFVLKSGVKLYGGFAGTENSPAGRDIALHTSELSGNIGDLADSTDNSYTILYLPYPDTTTRVDGFTLRHGYAHSDTTFFNFSPTLSGAAAYVQAAGGVGLALFAYCTFRDNSALSYGGAVFVNGQNTQGSTPVFQYCDFFNNVAHRHGGAIYIIGGNAYDRGMEFDHCRFIDNRAVAYPTSQAGGIYWDKQINPDENIDFIGCVMNENRGRNISSFLSLWVGDVGAARLRIDSCTVQGNQSDLNTYVFHAISFSLSCQIIKVSNSMIRGNQTPVFSEGGGCDTDTLFLLNNEFFGNPRLVTWNGYLGAYNNIFRQNPNFWFHSSYSHITLLNNVFIENGSFGRSLVDIVAGSTESQIVGNLFIRNQVDSVPNLLSQLIYRDTTLDTLKMYGNIFLDNIVNGQIANVSRTTILQNNIIIGNKRAGHTESIIPFSVDADSSYLSHNLLDINCAQILTPGQCGPGNIFTTDALLTDTAAGDYRPLPCSPAVNAGLNDIYLQYGILTDQAGQPRIQDGVADIGPYESLMLAEALAAFARPACPGAANGSVVFDLLYGCSPFAFQWSGDNGMGSDTAGLAPGDYAFTLTDQRGKTWIQNLSVSESPPVSASGIVQPASCFDCADGGVTIQIESGMGPFSYVWSDGSTDTLLAGAPPGAYGLSLTDGMGCVYAYEFTVSFESAADEAGVGDGLWLSIQPNPVSVEARLDFSEHLVVDAQLLVLDAGGRLMHSAVLPSGLRRYRIPTAGWLSGAYAVTVQTAARIETKKILVR